jgi:ribosomal protein L7/L12
MKLELTVEEFQSLFIKANTIPEETFERIILRFKDNKDKIGACMFVRAIKGWSLVEAKNYCDIKFQ